MEDGTLYLITEKLAYRPSVIFMILLFCPVSCWTKQDTSQIAEEIFWRHTIQERTAFKVLAQRYLHAGCTNYLSIWITWRWNNFRWKQISRMDAISRNSQNYGPRNISALRYFFGISVRNFGIPGVTTKPWDYHTTTTALTTRHNPEDGLFPSR